jgi:diadenosine tetraphosphate (Ap4A) HIT family hydrolase
MSTELRDCRVCATEATPGLPLRERVHVDDHWRLATAFDSSLPGWLVLLPRRHVEGLHELTAEEAGELGHLLRAASAALVEVTGCVKTYVALFAEAEGFSHLHVHVVPRPEDLRQDRRGPRVFGHLGAGPDAMSEADRDSLAARLGPSVTRNLARR